MKTVSGKVVRHSFA